MLSKFRGMSAALFHNPAFISIVSGLTGALLGALITVHFSLAQFEKEQRISRYVSIVEEIDRVLNLNEALHNHEKGTVEYDEAINAIELALNRAYTKSMVFLPDDTFRQVSPLLNGKFDKYSKNKIYYLFRKDLFPKTEIDFEEVKEKFIKVKKENST